MSFAQGVITYQNTTIAMLTNFSWNGKRGVSEALENLDTALRAMVAKPLAG